MYKDPSGRDFLRAGGSLSLPVLGGISRKSRIGAPAGFFQGFEVSTRWYRLGGGGGGVCLLLVGSDSVGRGMGEGGFTPSSDEEGQGWRCAGLMKRGRIEGGGCSALHGLLGPEPMVLASEEEGSGWRSSGSVRRGRGEGGW